jgi:hypothetical protein
MSSENQNRIKDPQTHKDSSARSWIIVLAVSLFFFLWGLFIFFAVGDGWPPPWRYGTVPDVPGQSVYSVQGAEERAGTAPLGGETIREQHIMGKPEETGRPQGKKGL